jgi:hypothetical protein
MAFSLFKVVGSRGFATRAFLFYKQRLLFIVRLRFTLGVSHENLLFTFYRIQLSIH